MHLWVFVSRVLGSSQEPVGQAVQVADQDQQLLIKIDHAGEYRLELELG